MQYDTSSMKEYLYVSYYTAFRAVVFLIFLIYYITQTMKYN